MLDYGLRDRTVMVTGAADAIGRRCVEVLLTQGARNGSARSGRDRQPRQRS